MVLTWEQKQDFLETLWRYYAEHKRDTLPWRQPEPDGTFDAYKILVSELMLQQTQVERVMPKFDQFVAQFPDVQTLAAASLGDVLRAWQGLGYNRRAKFLWQTAQYIARSGWPENLTSLSGVGINTAGAIRVYAWNEPTVFVETNIRTVYMYHFAADAENVSDDFIREVLKQTLDHEHPREFYWALMDYGSWLKTQVRNNAQSAQYSRQSRFMGSKRQVRGAVLKVLITGPQTIQSLQTCIHDDRLDVVIQELTTEGFVRKTGRMLQLT